jgi:hypothetical protein
MGKIVVIKIYSNYHRIVLIKELILPKKNVCQMMHEKYGRKAHFSHVHKHDDKVDKKE